MALPALAQNSQTQSPPQSSDPGAIMRAYPYLRPPEAIPASPDTSTFRIGNSKYVISGPLVQGLNRPPLSIGQPGVSKRMIVLPVNLLTPLPVSLPPEKNESYFKWHSDGTQPWVNVTAGAPATTDDPALTDKPVGLISISR